MNEEKAQSLQDGEHRLEDGTLIKVVDGVTSIVPEGGEKPLFDPGIKIDPRAEPNTVHASLTKFSEGQEVKTPSGHIGRIVFIKDGGYAVTVPGVESFSEDQLEAVDLPK